MPGTGAKTETDFNSQPGCYIRRGRGYTTISIRTWRGKRSRNNRFSSGMEIGESRITERRCTRRNRSETSRRDQEKPATMARRWSATDQVAERPINGFLLIRCARLPTHRDYNASRAPIFSDAGQPRRYLCWARCTVCFRTCTSFPAIDSKSHETFIYI